MNKEYTEKDLFEKYAETKDSMFRDQIVLNNMYIVNILAKKFSGRGVEFDDLKQVASLALLKAVDRFDSSKDIKFSTFVTPSIIGELKNYFRDKSRLIKVSRKEQRLIMDIRKIISEYASTNSAPPTAGQIAEYLQVPVEDVIRVIDGDYGTVSLDSTINESNSSLYDVIPYEKDDYETFENRDFFRSCFELLNDNEKKLITMRYVQKKSQTDCAVEMNVSQMFVSRLEKKIIQKLRQKMKNDL